MVGPHEIISFGTSTAGINSCVIRAPPVYDKACNEEGIARLGLRFATTVNILTLWGEGCFCLHLEETSLKHISIEAHPFGLCGWLLLQAILFFFWLRAVQ